MSWSASSFALLADEGDNLGVKILAYRHLETELKFVTSNRTSLESASELVLVLVTRNLPSKQLFLYSFPCPPTESTQETATIWAIGQWAWSCKISIVPVVCINMCCPSHLTADQVPKNQWNLAYISWNKRCTSVNPCKSLVILKGNKHLDCGKSSVYPQRLGIFGKGGSSNKVHQSSRHGSFIGKLFKRKVMLALGGTDFNVIWCHVSLFVKLNWLA